MVDLPSPLQAPAPSPQPLPPPGRSLRESYWLTRLVFLRSLGLIYFVAFLSLSQQWGPLLGSDGLLPVRHYLRALGPVYGGRLDGFLAVPSLFWLGSSDAVFSALAYLGIGLSLLVLVGFANAPLLAALWFLYMSFVHVGQLFYGYGWEILLLETGFLAIFLCPLLDPRPLPAHTPPPKPVIWLLRWVLFRVMFGAGLIKLRGDPCWRDLTCMIYHYQTQPLPNPLSWYLHQLPPAYHELEVLGNHFVELIVPWTFFGPRRLRHVGGLFVVGFQLMLVLSGNLSFLNWLTITVCLACFDDQALAHVTPRALRVRLAALLEVEPSRGRRFATYAVTALILCLSVQPARNLVSSQQVMNGSFDAFDLVNTYGAFGSIGRVRREIILEGTDDATIGPTTRWREYEFHCKPGDVNRRPCIASPYHYRIDWQMWFAAMEDYSRNPWLVHFVYQLLRGDRAASTLLAGNPFPQTPPKFIRAELYEYAFTRIGDKTSAWWTRRRMGAYLPALSADNPALIEYLRRYDWLPDATDRR